MEQARADVFLEATFAAMEEGISIYDEHYRLVAWNKRYQELRTGINPKFFKRGASLFDLYRESAESGLFGPGDPKEIAQERINSIESGPLIKTDSLSSPNGRVIRVNRFRIASGGVCATFKDITEENQIKTEMRQASKMEAMGRFASGIAHDVNNILTIIVGAAEGLSGVERLTGREEIQQILKAAERGVETTKQLLAFARRRPLKTELLDVGEALHQIFALLREDLPAKIKLNRNLSNDLWTCRVDRVRLANTIVNLVNNANHAVDGAGTITLGAKNVWLSDHTKARLEVDGREFVHIKVIDDGVGMSADVLKHALDPFFTTKPYGTGTGLGLSLAHGFMAQSNGAIEIDSNTTGTTINLYLPRSVAGQSSTHESESS